MWFIDINICSCFIIAKFDVQWNCTENKTLQHNIVCSKPFKSQIVVNGGLLHTLLCWRMRILFSVCFALFGHFISTKKARYQIVSMIIIDYCIGPFSSESLNMKQWIMLSQLKICTVYCVPSAQKWMMKFWCVLWNNSIENVHCAEKQTLNSLRQYEIININAQVRWKPRFIWFLVNYKVKNE